MLALPGVSIVRTAMASVCRAILRSFRESGAAGIDQNVAGADRRAIANRKLDADRKRVGIVGGDFDGAPLNRRRRSDLAPDDR